MESSGVMDCAVLDLGASPGGWSQWLLQHGVAQVVAVDPAAIAADVSVMPGFTHIRLKVEVAVERGLFAGFSFRLIVCDMNMHPEKAAEAINSIVPLLKPGAMLLLTLKMVRKGRNSANILEEQAREALKDLWTVEAVVQLFTNSKQERTLLAVLR
uniref:Ribosomal RNA methyltransferase FtsJ domain-containing protein n=2 Tax=Octactis speculum TaxID=3111310 RepID=A0A7S2GKU3_9STRA|mmetsp:Transcript_48946/g.66708  ORF Transcript_48946/g.66708 Transcript_48946/m.66708 type:complete len:156 (+) Transcript_48946:48-515(+)